MAQRWYYARGGQKIGPVTSQELRYLAASGGLQPTDLVWVEGNDRGNEARSVVGLFPAANGEGRPEPPPLPKERIADAGSTQGAMAAGGSLAEKLGNLTETTKAAARLAAAQARKAHLVNVTLPAAYLDLGRDIYAAGRFRDEFPEQYAEIERVQTEIAHLTTGRGGKPGGTFAEKAGQVASKIKDTAKARAMTLKLNSSLRRLGESVFASHGQGSSPESLVGTIIECLTKIRQAEEEIRRELAVSQGQLLPIAEIDDAVGGAAGSTHRQPWYCHGAILSLATLLCFPITLALVWWKSTYSKQTKWAWTVFCVLYAIVLSRGYNANSDKATTPMSPPAMVASEPGPEPIIGSKPRPVPADIDNPVLRNRVNAEIATALQVYRLDDPSLFPNSLRYYVYVFVRDDRIIGISVAHQSGRECETIRANSSGVLTLKESSGPSDPDADFLRFACATDSGKYSGFFRLCSG